MGLHHPAGIWHSVDPIAQSRGGRHDGSLSPITFMSTAVLEAEAMEESIAAAPGKLLSAGALSRENADWLAEMQSVAWESFESLPMPLRKDEAWRFASIKELDLARFHLPHAIDDHVRVELTSRSRGLEKTAGRMIFGNDQLIAREVLSEALRQKGVIWMPLEQAAVEHPELFRSTSCARRRFSAGRNLPPCTCRKHALALSCTSRVVWKSISRSKPTTGCTVRMAPAFRTR
jgi:hypothetical protein